MMKAILAAVLTVLLLIPSAASAGSKPYDYEKWTTAALQQRRVECYKAIPVRANRKHLTMYSKHGGAIQPEEEEIRRIELELNRRRSLGDKAAYFEPGAPQHYKHKNPAG